MPRPSRRNKEIGQKQSSKTHILTWSLVYPVLHHKALLTIVKVAHT